MKTQYLIISFLLIVFADCSRKNDDQIFARSNCKIRSIITQDTSISESKYTYNDSGLLGQQTNSTKDPGATYVSVSNYYYDSENFLVRLESEYKTVLRSGKIYGDVGTDKTTYVYNEKGQIVLVSTVLSNPNYSGNSTVSYEYDNDKLVQITEKRSDSEQIILFNSNIPSALISKSNFYSQAVNKLNSSGFVSESTRSTYNYSTNQKSVTTTSYAYDNLGNLIKVIYSDENGNISSNEYTYDNKKNPKSLDPVFKGIPTYNLYGREVNNMTSAKYSYSGYATIEQWTYEYNKNDFPSRVETHLGNQLRTINYNYLQCD